MSRIRVTVQGPDELDLSGFVDDQALDQVTTDLATIGLTMEPYVPPSA